MEEYDVVFYVRGAYHTVVRFVYKAPSLDEAVRMARVIFEEYDFFPLNDVTGEIDRVVVSRQDWSGSVETGKTIYFR